MNFATRLYVPVCVVTIAACSSYTPYSGTADLLADPRFPAGATSSTAAKNATGSLSASASTLVLNAGETAELSTFLRRPGGGNVSERVVYISSNERVASVGTTSGQIRAEAVGKAVITASLASDSASRVAIEVSVVEKHAVLLVKVEPGTPMILIGQSLPLKAQVTMADGQVNGNVSWSSSDNTIATVNPTTGEVTGLREGKVSILAAYSADPRYRGLAEVEVVKEFRATPSPTPDAFTFKPGATPLPGVGTKSPKPDTANPPSSDAEPADTEDTLGTTLVGDTSLIAPSFSSVRDFGESAVFTFIDFRRVVVAENTKLTATVDGGKRWTIYNNVGSQRIKAMHWLTETDGWVAGDGGTVLKVSVKDGQLSYEPQVSGTTAYIRDIFFMTKTEGLIFSGWDQVLRTDDGGRTWGNPVGIDTDHIGSLGTDGFGGAIINTNYGPYRYVSGAFERIFSSPDGRFRAVNAKACEGQALIQGYQNNELVWLSTRDWKNFKQIPKYIKTQSQVIQPESLSIFPILPDAWVAQEWRSGASSRVFITRNGGELWSEPKDCPGFSNLVPFNETQMWAYGRGSLFRAGY